MKLLESTLSTDIFKPVSNKEAKGRDVARKEREAAAMKAQREAEVAHFTERKRLAVGIYKLDIALKDTMAALTPSDYPIKISTKTAGGEIEVILPGEKEEGIISVDFGSTRFVYYIRKPNTKAKSFVEYMKRGAKDGDNPTCMCAIIAAMGGSSDFNGNLPIYFSYNRTNGDYAGAGALYLSSLVRKVGTITTSRTSAGAKNWRSPDSFDLDKEEK